MSSAPLTAPTSAAQASLAIVNQLNAGYPARDFAIRFWDGTTVGPENGQPARFTLTFQHPGSLRQMIWPFNPCNGGEAYIFGDIDLEGDLRGFFALMRHWQQKREHFSLWEKLAMLRRIMALPSEARPRSPRGAQLQGEMHSADRDRQAVQYHYDGPPSEFYALFLDPHMQYSCAYFHDPDEELDAAQERKLDYICRKLRLKPGERLIDFGCGWGGLITFAARHYGVNTFGVSVSNRQIEWCRRRIAELGLQDRCRVEYCDYRNVPETEPFDKAVSVGFIEHLGEKNFPTFFAKVWRLLRPQGLYLHHGITFKPFAPFPPWRAFALKYIFPDGELVPITNTIEHLAKTGFEVRDVENLREHYALTLERWRQRLEDRHQEAVKVTDEVTYRIYRIFFAGAAEGFWRGFYNLNQTLVVKSGDCASGLPLTRGDLYR